jgi:hypothetical protein
MITPHLWIASVAAHPSPTPSACATRCNKTNIKPNFTNQSTQYQNGVDMHFDWGASQFLTKQVQVGVVGYVYRELGCDTGAGDRVGCFQSQVVGAGPQVGFIIPLSTTTQGYLNLRSYWEFANQNRPDGWNAWVTFVISPAEQTPSTPLRRMITK